LLQTKPLGLTNKALLVCFTDVFPDAGEASELLAANFRLPLTEVVVLFSALLFLLRMFYDRALLTILIIFSAIKLHVYTYLSFILMRVYC
jgi:hypothetical protein